VKVKIGVNMQTIPEKTTLMILGSDHLSNPGVNYINYQYDDVFAPKRQREIKQLVKRLKAFSPTKIAITMDERLDEETEQQYQGYLNGTYKLTRSQYDQIGFQLAKELKHSKLYCIDYNLEADSMHLLSDPSIRESINFVGFAKAHNQEHLLPDISAEGKVTQDNKGVNWINSEQYESMIDIHRRLNLPETLYEYHQMYLQIAKIGQGDQYPGANWVTYIWYARNIKIYSNLTRITDSPDDRILLIICAGHVFLVQRFLEDSGNYTMEDVLKYLNTE